MATLTASHFVSRASSHGSSAPETKSFARIGLGGLPITHSGLRRVSARTVVRSSNVCKSESSEGLATGDVVCQSGMSVVFVGCEVGPWSKTGGLGDVLGGLPPALAVSVDDWGFLLFLVISSMCTG